MILVTGATGVVGSQIIKQLHKEGHPIRATKRPLSDCSWTQHINSDIDWVEADLLDIYALDKAFEGISHVIHCAAIVSFDNSNDSLMHRVNIKGTKNLLTLCQKHDIQKLIYISSVAAIGRTENSKTITEEAKWEESSLNTAYANTKYLAELEVWRAQEEGLPTVILNPSIIIGPGNWNSASLKLFSHVKNGNPLYPTGSLNYVDVRDVAQISLQFLFNNIQGERYILNAGIISYHALFNLVAVGLNKKAPWLKINPTITIFAAYLLKSIRLVSGINFNITTETAKLSRLSIYFSAKKVKKELNFEFRLIENSINWTCKQLEIRSIDF